MVDVIAQKWAVYEANVQQYRVLSATVQSFLLAVGSIWFSASTPPPAYLLIVILLFGLGHIAFVWTPVVHSRVRIVDYYKGQLELPESTRREIAIACSEKMYEKDKEMRQHIARVYFDADLRKPVRDTRFKLDVVVPIAYAFIWILMGATKVL